MNNYILLHEDLYDIVAIKHAIKAYENISEINIKKQGAYYKCVFVRCNYGFERTSKEFENYLIGCTRKNDY